MSVWVWHGKGKYRYSVEVFVSVEVATAYLDSIPLYYDRTNLAWNELVDLTEDKAGHIDAGCLVKKEIKT